MSPSPQSRGSPTAGLNLPSRTHVVAAGRPYEVRCSQEGDALWRRCERELERQGVPIPLDHRLAWVSRIAHPHCLISAHELDGLCRAAFAVELTTTRAAPGHVIARAERVGPSADPAALCAALDGWSRMFTMVPRILRMEVGLLSFQPEVSAALADQLARGDFRRVAEPQGYERTSLLHLGPTEDELFAGLHHTARRHIRAAAKNPVRLSEIRSPAQVEAMQPLLLETRRRTRGGLPKRTLDEIVAVAHAHPELLRIVGLFAEDDGRLLAFATGHFNGDHVTYGEAASTRDAAHRFPLGYAPLWDLILWAKRRGATWFDLGGITSGSHATPGDRLGGISDFKRYFRGDERTVGEEWVAEPHAVRAAVASRVSKIARWARGAFKTATGP